MSEAVRALEAVGAVTADQQLEAGAVFIDTFNAMLMELQDVPDGPLAHKVGWGQRGGGGGGC